MAELFEIFVYYAANLAQIDRKSIAAQGFTFLKPTPHIHGFLYSTKSRKSGRNIVNLSTTQREELQNFWLWEIDGYVEKTGSLDIQNVWGPMGLVDYLADDHNISRPGQMSTMLPTINPELLTRKLKRAGNRKTNW
jgi:hypothetical protein